jgi:CspA family cold shock protein
LTERETGTVKWFNISKGYGFIRRDAGGDVFVHRSAIQRKEYLLLFEGERVEFIVVQGERGPRAEQVVLAQQE